MSEQYDDELFDSRREYKNEYSTFIEELQQSTEKLMNEVFNTQYIPDINQEDDPIQKFSQSAKQYGISSMGSSRNSQNYNKFNSTKRTNISRNNEQKQLSESFVKFLTRNQKWKQRRLQRAKNQQARKDQEQVKGLTFIPSILRASKEKLDPIYDRCLDLQKQKQKKLAMKKIEKQKKVTNAQAQCTFQPKITTKAKNRTLDEYLKDKQEWNSKKKQYIQNSKIISEARKYQECLFHPILVAKYNKTKKNFRKNEKVEDRLLRSLQKPLQN